MATHNRRSTLRHALHHTLLMGFSSFDATHSCHRFRISLCHLQETGMRPQLPGGFNSRQRTTLVKHLTMPACHMSNVAFDHCFLHTPPQYLAS